MADGVDGGDAAGGFYSDFMVLRPDKGGLYDIFHLLFSCKVSENAAVDCDCPAGTEIADWRRRWAVFVSLVAQVAAAVGEEASGAAREGDRVLDEPPRREWRPRPRARRQSFVPGHLSIGGFCPGSNG